MTKIQLIFIALASATVACSPVASQTTQTEASESPVSVDIAMLVSAAVPGITIIGGELNASGNQYEVTGTLPNGDEIEVDMVQSNGAWTVDEIQRDIAWSTVPEPVRAAAGAAPDSFEPVRIIESTQAADGSIVYELFRAMEDGSPSRGPAMEVRWHDGSAEVMP
ncbi:MAG: hypothetical protein OXQ29_10165 [Rhodospirillaceae bacterium]|nr:hypothetical protein [Rhodospirillaceae bacterium]